MSNSSTSLAFTWPITQTTIDRALCLAHTQPPDTAERAYRNAIAVLVAQDYCAFLGLEADLTQSNALAPIACMTSDTADLPLVEVGSIECRLVDPEAEQWDVPLDARVDRAAFLAIALIPDSNYVQILGFAPALQGEPWSRQRLQPLEDFGAYLTSFEESNSSAAIELMQWFEASFDHGWQVAQEFVETISQAVVEEVDRTLNPPKLAFRSAASAAIDPIQKTALRAIGGTKRFHFDPGGTVLLTLAITEYPDMLSVQVSVLAPDSDSRLPDGLQCAVLDLDARSVMQLEASAGDDLQLEFDMDADDTFGIRLTLGEVSITEFFAA